MSGFLFVVCQAGAEAALKNEVARKHPTFRFAFSRPGFVTFRVPEELSHDRKFDLNCVFGRTWGYSLGKVTGTDVDTLVREVWTELSQRYPSDVLRKFRHLHVWQRDSAIPGDNDFEPGISPLADEIGEALLRLRPQLDPEWSLLLNEDAQPEDRVLDCVLVEPGEWWFGWHRAKSLESCWPGGVPEIEIPEDMVSRTYMKMAESLLWSDLPIKRGDACVEIGSSPGGSCQALLRHGCAVTGIDPADMDPLLTSNPMFTHIKGRAKTLKRKVFSRFRWLMADASVAPRYTLDTVEAIVTHSDVKVRGLILTLKLTTWNLAEQIPLFNKRVREWGFQRVRARQLAFNRQEICLVATDFKRPAATAKPTAEPVVATSEESQSPTAKPRSKAAETDKQSSTASAAQPHHKKPAASAPASVKKKEVSKDRHPAAAPDSKKKQRKKKPS